MHGHYCLAADQGVDGGLLWDRPENSDWLGFKLADW